MKKTLLGLALLLSLTPASGDEIPNIVGRYRYTKNHTMTFTVDKDLRITTTIVVVNQQTGERYPITFPHHLKFYEFTSSYESKGTFKATYFGVAGQKNCEFPLTFEGDFGTDAKIVDVTLTAPKNYGLDPTGQCYSEGERPTLFGFDRY